MSTVAEGHELAGRYVVGQQLGVGGSGSVWKAHDTVLDRAVAVKVVDDGVAAARLAREARATAGIGVPNVVGVYDVGEQAGVHFLVMEYVNGVDLATVLRHGGPLEPDLAALVGRDVARGVAAVHGADLIHRDVTPANVLVTVEGEVKLTDLGIAQRTGAEDTQRLTQVGTVVGTVDYLAPEQVDGGEVTAASDVYAVGLLLHTACTGRAPFGDGPVSERVARRLATGPDRLGGDTGGLADVVATAVERDPSERYPDGRALRDALAAIVPDDAHPLRMRLAERVAAAAAGRSGGAVATPDSTTDGQDAPPAAADADATTVLDTGTGDGGATTVLATDGSTDPGDGATTVLPVDLPDGADEPGGDGGRRSVLLPLLGGILGIIAVVVVGTALSGGGSGDPGGEGGSGDQRATIEIAGVDDHDPLGGGGEHPEDIGLVADGDTSTTWDTEGYDDRPDLGGLKAGVGFLVDLGESTDVAAAELDLVLDGVDVTVTVSEERPNGDPTEEATVLGAAEGAGGTTRIEGEAITGRWVAVWFTSLAPDGGRFRAEVAEVRVFAP